MPREDLQKSPEEAKDIFPARLAEKDVPPESREESSSVCARYSEQAIHWCASKTRVRPPSSRAQQLAHAEPRTRSNAPLGISSGCSPAPLTDLRHSIRVRRRHPPPVPRADGPAQPPARPSPAAVIPQGPNADGAPHTCL